MTTYADNITDAVAKAGGAVHVAPAGTTPPTDASTALAATFNKFHSKKDGVTIKANKTTVAVDSWEEDGVAELEDATSMELTINPVEDYMLNAYVAGLMFPADSITTDSTTGAVTGIADGDGLPDECVLVVETLTRGGTHKKRYVFPRFQPYSKTDEVLKRASVTQPNITGKCLPDASGKRRYVYIAAVQ